MAKQIKTVRKDRQAEKPKGDSKYFRKAEYLRKHDKWGFEVPEPKPWRSR